MIDFTPKNIMFKELPHSSAKKQKHRKLQIFRFYATLCNFQTTVDSTKNVFKSSSKRSITCKFTCKRCLWSNEKGNGGESVEVEVKLNVKFADINEKNGSAPFFFFFLKGTNVTQQKKKQYSSLNSVCQLFVIDLLVPGCTFDIIV